MPFTILVVLTAIVDGQGKSTCEGKVYCPQDWLITTEKENVLHNP